MKYSEEELVEVLSNYWGYDQFRPLQLSVINAVLSGKDCLALMPTGGGKSLCFQVPTLAEQGLCLVISPLIALMKDQVENLRRKNITSFFLHGGMSRNEVINTLKVASSSNCRFLYVSPERLESALFKEYLPSLDITLVAIDEAHCVSQWGYDFRPPYLRIAALREELPGVPFLALTASATPAVQQDILDKLAMKAAEVFRQSFERPKLSYSVFKPSSKLARITEILSKVQGSAIVYCRSRRRTKEISDMLNGHSINADYYHAGLDGALRNEKQEAWVKNTCRVIVCTNAFGMGIDKPDVRMVIHADLPDCLENYYQEAGRAGRDGKMAYAVLLYDDTDVHQLHDMADVRFPSTEKVKEVYQALANYLHIPSNSGLDLSYDFDMQDFTRKFNLDPHTVIYSLKTLEQDGWINFNEQVFLPASVMFATNKQQLYEFENENARLEPLIKTLLRTYEGVFDQPVFISEKFIASLLQIDQDLIKQQLLELDRSGIIDYSPQKDKPQIYFTRNRVKVEELVIDQKKYEERKKQFEQRARQMMDYTIEPAACRSQVIAAYFGDNNVRSCGVCDNCLKLKSTEISTEEFEQLTHRILNMVKYEPMPGKMLIEKLSGVQKEKAWKVIEFLQAENKISTDVLGRVVLKTH